MACKYLCLLYRCFANESGATCKNKILKSLCTITLAGIPKRYAASKLIFLKGTHLNPLAEDAKAHINSHIYINGTSKFHTNAILYAKEFQENENEFFHLVLEGSPSYEASVIKHPLSASDKIPDNDDIEGLLDVNLSEKSPSELVDMFRILSSINRKESLNLEDPMYKKLMSAICTVVKELAVHDLLDVLHSLCLWPPTSASDTPQFKMLWNTLDFECANRSHALSTDVQLLIADYWFHLRLNRISKYNKTMIDNLFKNIKDLSPSQVVQLSFFLNLQRKVPSPIMRQLEVKLANIIHTLNTEELGIVCLGYFKTQNYMTNSLLIALILDNVLNNIHEISSITIASFVKQFRFNISKQATAKTDLLSGLTDKYKMLIQRCVPYIAKWDPSASIQIALLSVQLEFYHPELLDAIINYVLQHVHSVRLKTITKLLYCVTTFNHFPERKGFFDMIIEDLRSERTEEISLYPYCLTSILLYFSYKGIYPTDLIAKAMEPTFISKIEKIQLDYMKDLAALDYSLEVELPQYSGPRLDLKKRRESFMKNKSRIPCSSSRNLTYREKVLLSVRDNLCDALGGHQYLCIRHVLPHLKNPDIILHLSSSGEPQPIPDAVHYFPVDKIMIPPKGEKWVCVMVCTKNNYINNTTQLVGRMALKKKQLKKLGYRVIEVPWFGSTQNLDRKQMQQYLQNLLYSSYTQTNLTLSGEEHKKIK